MFLALTIATAMAFNAPNLPPNRKAGPLKGSRAFADLAPEQQDIIGNPSIFAEKVLGMKLYPEQARCLDMIKPTGSRVSGRFCNEYGKTTRLIAGAILWHTTVFPRTCAEGGSITTSGSWNQVVNQLVPALKAYAHKFPWRFLEASIEYKGYPQWVGFSTSEPGRAEGFHGSPEHPLMAGADEAKTVPDAILQAFEDRCNAQRFWMFSSPGYAQGAFYRSHKDLAHLYKTFIGRAAVLDPSQKDGIRVSGETPHITIDTIIRRIQKWGLNHPLVRSMIFGDFMEIVEGSALSAADFEGCIEQPPVFNSVPERHAFLDFAGGGDENVIAFRMGNKVWIPDSPNDGPGAWRDPNEMASVGKFITILEDLKRRYGLKPEEVEGDASGIGSPMIKRFHELGWPIGEAFNQEAPRYDDHYHSLASESWFEACDKIKRKTVIIPDDLEFKAQAINRRSVKDDKGKLRIESKTDMRKATRPGGAVPCSPDRAEAIFGAIAPCPVRGRMNLVEAAQEEYGQEFEHVRIDETILAGMHAG